MKSKKQIALFSIAVFFLSLASAPTASAWNAGQVMVNAIGGVESDQGRAVATDTQGNVYTTGSFKDSVDFDPGSGRAIRTSTADGMGVSTSDIYVSKVNSQGNLVWIKNFGGVGDDEGTGITVDSSGNVYVIGNFFGAVDFNPGVFGGDGCRTEKSHLFVLKLTRNGAFQWLEVVELDDFAASISIIESGGSIYAAGVFTSWITFNSLSHNPLDGNVAGSSLVSADDPLTERSETDAFIFKLGAQTGNFIWAYDLGSDGNDQAIDVTQGPNGTVYVLGSFEKTVDLDFRGLGTSIFPVADGQISRGFMINVDQDGFLASLQVVLLNLSGNSLLTRAIWNGIAGANSRIYIQGSGFPVLGDIGAGQTVLAELGGDFAGAVSITLMGLYASLVATDLNLDKSGNLFVSGVFEGTVDAAPVGSVRGLSATREGNSINIGIDASGQSLSIRNPSSADNLAAVSSRIISDGGIDIFVAKFNSARGFEWAKSFGGVNEDFSQSSTVDNRGDIYITGSFEEIVDFDLDTGVAPRESLGSTDIFLLKVDSLGKSRTKDATIGDVVEPYLTVASLPRISLKNDSLTCSAGSYKAGFIVNGAINSTASDLFTPTSYTFKLYVNSELQDSQTLTTKVASSAWQLSGLPSGSLATCSVTVSFGNLISVSTSTGNNANLVAQQHVRQISIENATLKYNLLLSQNLLTYQKTLVENKAAWRMQVETVQRIYNDTLEANKLIENARMKREANKQALKDRILASRSSATDYAQSKITAESDWKKADVAALNSKESTLKEANLAYGAFLATLGYGVLLP